MNTHELSAKIVLVTGAGSGIGKATALAFAGQGASVIITDRNIQAGEQVTAQINESGGAARFIQQEVSQPARHAEVIQQIADEFGRLDVAINNAGVGGEYGRLTDQSPQGFEEIMAINVGGVFYGMQEQIRQMLRQQPKGGCIVNLSSIAGVRGMPMGAPYSASKHAVIGLTKTAALEYIRQGIRVNAVCPVYTHSAMVDELIQTAPGMEEKMRQRIPIGRLGQPEEIAQAILWLCSDANTFTSGQAIQLDGGLTAG